MVEKANKMKSPIMYWVTLWLAHLEKKMAQEFAAPISYTHRLFFEFLDNWEGYVGVISLSFIYFFYSLREGERLAEQ